MISPGAHPLLASTPQCGFYVEIIEAVSKMYAEALHFIVEKWVDPMLVKLVGEIVERYGDGYVL